MRISAVLSFLLFMLFGLPELMYSQEGNSFDQFKDDISNRLPPLSVLIDSAILHNGNLEYKDKQRIINECKLRSKKIEWTRNFGVQANIGYGNLWNYSSSSSGSIDPVPSTSSESQTQYNGAIYMNLPFSTLADRKNQIKIARTEMEQAQSAVSAQRDEIRQQVIVFYNDLILKQRLFKIEVRNLETVKINMQMVEKQFSNGVISLTDYTRMLGDVSHLETSYETARMDFLSAYMILEVVVGMKFNLVKTTPDTYEHN